MALPAWVHETFANIVMDWKKILENIV